jgi:cytochrome c-type biogenesis protein CcmH/NrfG
MSASTSNGRASAENELLSRLGLPPSATPEDVDQAHLAVSQFLAAAPAGLKAWARVQASALDEAYLQLTDPVGLEGSPLRSPTRPPTVVPGGPATPPARRDSVPATTAAPAAAKHITAAPEPAIEPDPEAVDDTDTDDLDALFASVTPGAHRDMVRASKPGAPLAAAAAAAPVRPAAPVRSAAPARVVTAKHKASRPGAPAAALAAPTRTGRDPWKAVAIVASVTLLVAALAFIVVPFVYNLGAGGTANAPSAAASDGTAVNAAEVTSLMQKITANPQDAASLQRLGDIYYGAQDYTDAGNFYDKILAFDPKNVQALIARGAVYYNAGDPAGAGSSWNKVVAIDPKNVEARWDLGFLALNQASPDWATVQSEWRMVIQLDPSSTFAQNAQQHLDALVKASMIPAPSGSAGASGAPSASGSGAPSATPAASPAPSRSTAP